MGTLITGLLIALAVFFCVRSIVLEKKRGELCECPGDCSVCKIQCRSSEKYYGKQR
ncbi:MAG: FeoB-associated Cys-rich membrane protein [Solobacterium sp.]|nr:FeoB-associated Cys-rich membrane protein [Solobacterium sp.]MBQ9823941.1 FeoB-associated Cys-rich membrane protein [Solobacterium sp.]